MIVPKYRPTRTTAAKRCKRMASGRGRARGGTDGTGGRDNSESTYFVTSVDKM